MSDNIREFHVPEKPRAKGDNIRTSLAKAKKYDILQEQIKKDLEAMQKCHDDLVNDTAFKFGYHKGYIKGALDVYQLAIFVLSNYLEQYTHESD